MSADPLGSPTSHERFRLWITDVEVTPGNSDPNCSFSAMMFIDHELVCNLPTIDSTGSLRWSGLFHCNVSPTSTVALRLWRSIAGKSRYFNSPPSVFSEVDEETGEVTLELAEAAWIVTIKLLTSATAGQLFPDKLEKLAIIERAYNSLAADSPETTKYLFKHALNFANLAVQVGFKGMIN
ncbi:vegetative incompatibility protein HET-E-1, putative, partial [Rhizoctonia solani AG-3 Rhs1AP]